MPQPMMACGCRANSLMVRISGVQHEETVPACFVHETSEQAVEIDLTGRVAHCAYGCGAERPSTDEGLAFFEFCGEGSASSRKCAECGYAEVAHAELIGVRKNRPGVVADGRCPGYQPRGDIGHDKFYCGCRGWD